MVRFLIETIYQIQNPGIDGHQDRLVKSKGGQQHGIFYEPEGEQFFNDGYARIAEQVVDLGETLELLLAVWREGYMGASTILFEKFYILEE